MDAVTHLAPTVGVVAACDSLGVARARMHKLQPCRALYQVLYASSRPSCPLLCTCTVPKPCPRALRGLYAYASVPLQPV